MKRANSEANRDRCCRQLLFAHYIDGDKPLVVLECCRCGRFWHRREDGEFVPYDHVVERLSLVTQGVDNDW